MGVGGTVEGKKYNKVLFIQRSRVDYFIIPKGQFVSQHVVVIVNIITTP